MKLLITFSCHSLSRMLWVLLPLLLCSCIALPVAPTTAANHVSDSQFSCGGRLELATWLLWEEGGLQFLRQKLIVDRLNERGDTYALYDMQTYFHNLVTLAQRCERDERMLQLADALTPVLHMLEPLPGNPTQRAWICRGGAVCNTRNGLINKEVMLVSVQGLGLMSHLAQMMSTSKISLIRNHPFVAAIAQISTEHLIRWGDINARANWRVLSQAQSSDVTDGSTALLFTDKPIWMINIYANLAGIYAQHPALVKLLTSEQREALSSGFRDLLMLLKARITIQTANISGVLSGEETKFAEIDKGFWRLYEDNRYAGYSSSSPPAVCTQQPDGSSQVQLNVTAKNIPIVADLGWDFSHARRLVHVFFALKNNNMALLQIYQLKADDLPFSDTEKAFAAQLVENVWNGNLQAPLFSNYWNGTNGWYRVGYDNGTGRCYSGYPPFSFTDSFATGGFITWASHYSIIGDLGRRIYLNSQAKDDFSNLYIQRHIGGLALNANATEKMLTQIMFWPTLIQ